MSEPYTVAMISHALAQMPRERLATIEPRVFQTWPVRKIVPTKVIRELIDYERAGRGAG